MNFRGRFFFFNFEFDISKKIGGMNLCQMRCLSDGFAVAIEYGFLPNKLPKHLGETHRKKLHPDGWQDGTMALRDMSWILLEMPCGSWIISPFDLMCYRTSPWLWSCMLFSVQNIWCGEKTWKTTVVVFVAIFQSFNVFVFMVLKQQLKSIITHKYPRNIGLIQGFPIGGPRCHQERIGVTGVSLGGMATWLLAAADERVYAAAPAIGVQSFHHAVEHVPELYQSKKYTSWLHRHIVFTILYIFEYNCMNMDIKFTGVKAKNS